MRKLFNVPLPPAGHRTGEGSESLLPYFLAMLNSKPRGSSSYVEQGKTGPERTNPQRRRTRP